MTAFLFDSEIGQNIPGPIKNKNYRRWDFFATPTSLLTRWGCGVGLPAAKA